MRYYLGLDNGGTTTKAALFDRVGREVCTASTSTQMITPKPGFVERDMEEMWHANCDVIRQVIRRSGVRPEEIAGVGICGHGKGLYLWGRDGRPVRRGIISTDNRAYAYAVRWREDGTEEKAFDRTCQHLMACQSVPLLAWIRDNEPENYANIQWVFECKDYVRFRLTGEARAELTDYSGTSLLNLHTRAYDDELLALFGLTSVRQALPPLCTSTQICGCVTEQAAAQCGLAAGTPVIGGMFDIDACALAVGVTDPSRICMIAGTWSINEYPRSAPVLDKSVRMNSLFCLPEYYLIEESSPTSAGNNEWFVKQLLPEAAQGAKEHGQKIYDEMNRWVAEIPPEEFVPVFLPFIMASNVHPNAKGTFVGISANHTRKHLVRSVYEGIAFCHKYHIDKLMRSRSAPPESIRMAGGAANSAVWVQIFADALQMPIETVTANETGALGCAIAVASAVGDFPSLNDAVNAMCRVAPAVLPDASKAEIYRRKYGLYKKAIDCLNPLWGDMQDLIEEDHHA